MGEWWRTDPYADTDLDWPQSQPGLIGEAAAEIGCEPDELEGTFPPEFVRLIKTGDTDT